MLAPVGELSPKTRGDLAGRGNLFVKHIPAKGKLKKNLILEWLPLFAVHGSAYLELYMVPWGIYSGRHFRFELLHLIPSVTSKQPFLSLPANNKVCNSCVAMRNS